MSAVRPTKKQRELLSFISGFIAGHGYGPSYREIMRALNYKSVSTVANHVDHLIQKGQLQKRDRSARSLEVCNVAEPRFTEKPVTKTEEKWLTDLINKRFIAAEQEQASSIELDNLYVLVGALHILGFETATTAYKSRLKDLVGKRNSA